MIYVLVGAGPIALSPISFLFYCTFTVLSAYPVLSQAFAIVLLSNSNPCFPTAKAHNHGSTALASCVARSIALSQVPYPPYYDYATLFTILLLQARRESCLHLSSFRPLLSSRRVR
jgi:hypothetical protein